MLAVSVICDIDILKKAIGLSSPLKGISKMFFTI